MPSHPLAQALISKADVAVAAPSANLFGRTSPTTAAHVVRQLEGAYSVLIDGGSCRVGVESTVLSLTGNRPRLLRAGGLAPEQLEEVIGTIARRDGEVSGGPGGGEPAGRSGESDGPGGGSPGRLPDHYAPTTPLKLVASASEYRGDERTAKLLFSGDGRGYHGPVMVLSPTGDLREAAVRLYHAVQLLDAAGADCIVAETAPEHGLGHAINDRLRKAAAK
jgi:L-threonylcarbamoyladenylate synthase